MATATKTRVVLFPTEATEYYVKPHIGTKEEEIAVLIPGGNTVDLNVEETVKEFKKRNCNKCPYLYDEVKEARKLKESGEASTLAEARDILKQKDLDKACNGTEHEMRYDCKFTDNYSGSQQISHTILPSLMLFNPIENKYNCHSLYIYMKEDDSIFVKPYRIGNVKEGGEICWGTVKKAGTLRAAWNAFWNSPFNTRHTSSIVDSDEYIDFVKNFDESSIKRNWIEYNFKDFIHIKDKQYDGVFYSKDPKILDLIPTQYHHKDNLVVGFFKRANPKIWIIDFNGYIAVRDGKMSTTASKIIPLGTSQELFS